MMLLMMMMMMRPWRLQHRRIEGEDSTGAEIEEGAQEGSTGAERRRGHHRRKVDGEKRAAKAQRGGQVKV